MVIAISEKRTSATTAKIDARTGEPGGPQATVERERREQDPDRRDRRSHGLQRTQRFASEDDRQHDRQATEGRDHPADDRDRPELQAREVRQVGARPDEPEQRSQPERAWVGRQAGACHQEDRDEGDRRHGLHPGRHPQAADDPAAECGDDIERAPEEGGRESGQESEGHPGSLPGRDGPRATIPARSPVRGRGAAARGDVAQLEEHCVRIAGVRGSSPLISTNSAPVPTDPVELAPFNDGPRPQPAIGPDEWFGRAGRHTLVSTTNEPCR